MPAPNAPTPMARNIRPSCDTVEYASTRLMSFCTRPMVPAIRAVGRADHRHDRQRVGREAEEHGVAPDQVDARGDHRRGVDEGRHRRRAFHGVRQPDVERNLRRLARRADEQQQRRDRRDSRSPSRGRRLATLPAMPWKSSVPNMPEQRQHAQNERVVADAVDDERLLAGVGRRTSSCSRSRSAGTSRGPRLPSPRTSPGSSGRARAPA